MLDEKIRETGLLASLSSIKANKEVHENLQGVCLAQII